MTQQLDSKGQLRSAFTMRGIESAKRSVHSGTNGVFIRVTLAIIFMYLIFVSYQVLGVTGPVVISVLFLAAMLVPFFYELSKDRLAKRMAKKEQNKLEENFAQEG